MTESLSELSADNSAGTVLQCAFTPKLWRQRFGGNDGHRRAPLQAAVGREIRSIRARRGMTAVELATAAGISAGTVSKVEKGSISPSLDTLQALSAALGVPVSALFRRFVAKSRAVLVKAGGGMNVEPCGARTGQWYKLLGNVGFSTGGMRVEPYLIILSKPGDEFPAFHNEAVVFLYMLEGELAYRHDDSLYRMAAGDSLLFDADALHGPDELTSLPIRVLSVSSCRVLPASG